MPAKRKAPAGCYWRGNTIWAKANVKGRQHRWSLHTDDTKIAKKRYDEIRERLIAALYHGERRLTVSEAIEAWGAWIAKQVSANTVKRYLVSLTVLEPWLDVYLDEIDANALATIIRVRQATGVTNATVKRDLGALSSVITFARLQGWIGRNPVKDQLEMIRERRNPIVLPPLADLRLVTRSAPGMLADLIAAAFTTGCRQEELAGAKRSQLDLKAKTLTVIGKRNKLRVIDLVPFGGVEIFAALPDGAPGAPLFWHGQARRYGNVANRFYKIVAGLAKKHPDFRRFRFHDIRHLHAVEWLRSGRSIYDLQKRLGHTSLKTTEVYLAYLTPEQERKVKEGAVK